MLLDGMCARNTKVIFQKRKTSLLQALDIALKSHVKVQEFQISKFKMSFKSPHKWTVVLLGSSLGLN
jgi:hypothetical protein